MSVKVLPGKDVERILRQVSEGIRQMADDPANPKRNKVIQEIADVVGHMSADGLRYQLLSVKERKEIP